MDRLWTEYRARILGIYSPLCSKTHGVQPLPSSPLSSPPPVYVVLPRDMCVDVLSRDVLTPAVTCVGILVLDPEFLRVCMHASRSFEWSERIRGTRLCLKLSMPVNAHPLLNILDSNPVLPLNSRSYRMLCYRSGKFHSLPGATLMAGIGGMSPG